MRYVVAVFTFILALGLTLTGCDSSVNDSQTSAEGTVETSNGKNAGKPGGNGGPYTFSQPVFDIEATPNGNILVAETVLGGVATGSTTIWEILTQGRQSGKKKVTEFTTPGEVTPIHGMASVGQRNFFAARGGLDLAANAAVLQVTPEGPQVVGDIEAFETANDPDLFAIEDWKDPKCAPASGPFTPGPQSNPYHLARTSGNTVLVADAAGNTLLRVKKNGPVELVALFTPPTAGPNGDGGASATPGSWLEFPYDGPDGGEDDDSTDDNADADENEEDDPSEGNCYVQPVSNSVTVGEDGSIYVGELTGVGALGVSRVWRIEPGTTGAVCPSEDCEMIFNGFTSIIDMTVGPDGYLYVVEYDEAGWLTSLGVGTPEGGTVNKCDVGTGGTCEVATIGGEELSDLTFPTALTFDKWGDAWLLENNLAAPTVRKLK
jgi:hypothetical protein